MMQKVSVHDEKFAEENYKRYLRVLEESLGSEETSNEELDEIAKVLFPDKWKGVFPSDGAWPRRSGYAVVNLDPAGQPGSHWVAVGDGMVYDSFGRLNILNGSRGLPQPDLDAEQRDEEDNCGPRSLAWLMVLYEHGSALAALI